ncbi:UDP-N-acetylglucosamine transferase subunit ALG14 homolog isoform X2 [Pogoniulus pusillus]|uniref:UDP-N-acetylglucosamine transferase subunit ALG14 homolog isoform X2 n=1 Tax=Pogoniulus pusillus TaxID=488313 RepID=UPI0030B96687
MDVLLPLVPLLLLLSLLLVPLAFLARRPRCRRTPPLSLLVVAGSGGHTTEILRLLSCLSDSYSPRHYVFADSDEMSEAKICSFEQKKAETFSNSQILCNGPGTCVPVCISALLLGLLRMKRAVIVYVESICRVETLSLSGKILYYLSDYFIVQWPELKEKYPRSVYLGRVV